MEVHDGMLKSYTADGATMGQNVYIFGLSVVCAGRREGGGGQVSYTN